MLDPSASGTKRFLLRRVALMVDWPRERVPLTRPHRLLMEVGLGPARGPRMPRSSRPQHWV